MSEIPFQKEQQAQDYQISSINPNLSRVSLQNFCVGSLEATCEPPPPAIRNFERS